MYFLVYAKTVQMKKWQKKFVSFMLEPENAKMYIDDQFAFSAVKGVEQENETVAGVKEDIAAGKVANFPDHYYPSGFDMSALLTEMCPELHKRNGQRGEHKSVPCTVR